MRAPFRARLLGNNIIDKIPPKIKVYKRYTLCTNQ